MPDALTHTLEIRSPRADAGDERIGIHLEIPVKRSDQTGR